MKVFVYGTLMKGMQYHNLLQDARFLGKAMVKGVGLYCVTAQYPGVIPMMDGFVRS